MYKYVLLAVFFIVSLSALYPQDYDFAEQELETILESIAKRSNNSNIIARIESYINNPIELTGSSIKHIAQIPLFTYSMARNIKKLAIKDFDIPEIIDSLNLDKEKAYLLNYCTYIDRRSSGKKSKPKFKFLSRTRDIEQFNRLKGFEKNKFTGDGSDIYQRILCNYNVYSAGLLFSKDLGELYKNSFISGFISATYDNFRISIGDFYIQTGLGNILWSPNSMGKGAEVISPAFQYDNSIYNYKSSGEYGFFRGITLSNSFKFTDYSSLNISAWASSAPRSATIGKDNSITSLTRTGLFRTETEIAKQNIANEKNIGANILFANQEFNIGITTYYLNYDRPVNTSSANAIKGKDAFLSSVYAIVPFNPFTLSTEISIDGKRNTAFKLIAEFKQKDYALILHGRSFASNFRSPYGYMFGEQSSPANEYGIYCGFMYKGWQNIKTVTYLDYYGSYEHTYYLPVPMKGIDILNQTTVKINSQNELRVRFQFETKTSSKKIKSEKKVFNRSKHYARADYIYQPNDILKLRTRIDLNLINFESVLPTQTGVAAYIEAQYKPSDMFKISGRLAYFSTDGYQSAIWQFEYAIPGYMYMPPLYGNGLRSFISVNFVPLKELSFWLRYVIMKKYNVNTLGSSYNQIAGNIDRRLYLQIDIAY